MTCAALPPLTARITVDRPRADAFQAFTADFDRWWPATFTWAQPTHLDHMVFPTHVDGLLSEIGPHGFRLDWGRVTAWRPPEAVSFTWQIGPDRVPVPDPAEASTVHVTFTPARDRTTVAVSHEEWELHGDHGAAYREQMSPAWPMALEAFAASIG